VEVLDTRTNLIWLQNWNVNGSANWATQNGWAESLSFANSNDWRLPETSEYAALFTAYGDLTKVKEFENVQPIFYWSGTEITPGKFAWLLNPVTGLQNPAFQSDQIFAVAVRAVPEPQTLALALLALGAMVVARRRRPV
jgi:hypothetical protein